MLSRTVVWKRAYSPASCPKTCTSTVDASDLWAVAVKQCGCPVTAAKLAEESGKPKRFVVGNEETSCEQTARLNLARAKYKAAVEAMFNAHAATDVEPEASEGT